MDWAVRETGHVCDVLAQMPSRAMTVGNVDSNFEQRARHCEPTGPREARPDDRLREAIHLTVEKKEWFGVSSDSSTFLGDPTLPSRVVFVTVGLWWAGFSQITFARLPKSSSKEGVGNIISKG